MNERQIDVGMGDSWVWALRRGLVRLREARGWTQAELSRRSGLHRSTIQRLETMDPLAQRPQPVTLLSLAHAFGYGSLTAWWPDVVAAGEPDGQGLPVMTEELQRVCQGYLACTPAQRQMVDHLIGLLAAQTAAGGDGSLDAVAEVVRLGTRGRGGAG